MKRHASIVLASLAFLSALPCAAQAASAAVVSAIATPLHSGAGAEMLRADPGVLAARPLFDAREREALAALGRTALGEVLRLELANSSDLDRLRKLSADGRIPFRIEPNGIVLAMQSGSPLAPQAVAQREPLEARQWALHNDGTPQSIAIDDVNSAVIPGIVGEDLGIASLGADVGPHAPIIVAVLDTGADPDHPDLQGQLVSKPAECKALATYMDCLIKGGEDDKDNQKRCQAEFGSIDTDGNGYPMDCSGWDVTADELTANGVLGGPVTTDSIGHGTHVSGIIGGAVNGRGIRGAASNVRILPVKVINSSPNNPIRPQELWTDTLRASWPNLGDDPSKKAPTPNEKELKWTTGFADMIARGMLYAIRSGAQVVNMSLAWPAAVDSTLMREMVALARSRGIIVVASAGNDSNDAPVMPCHYDGVLCVGAIGPDGSLAHFSNFGPAVDVAAPGVSILSAWPMDLRSINFTERQGYEYKNGTSMASPFVAAAAARLLSAGVPAQEVPLRLMAGARAVRQPSYPGAMQMPKHVAFGSVDVARALKLGPQPLIVPATKERVRVNWDRRARAIPIALALRNAWTAAAGPVHIQAAVRGAGGLGLVDSAWALSSWSGGEVKTIQTQLDVLDVSFDGRFEIELSISGGGADRTFTIPVEVSVPVDVTWASRETGVSTLPVQGKIESFEQLWTLSGGSEAGSESYLAASEPDATSWRVQLIEPESGSRGLRAGGVVTLVAPKGELIWTDRIDVDQDGRQELGLVFRVAKKGLPSFRFEFRDTRDPKLALVRTLDYANKPSVVSENFQWLKLAPLNKAPELAVAWIGFGGTPEVEKPAFDPWNPNWRDSAEIRFYYLSVAGVRTVAPPDGWSFVQLLTADSATRKAGRVPVLLGKGDDYLLDYAVAEVRYGKDGPEVADLRPLGLERFRMLSGLDNLLRVTPLSGVERSATAIGGSVSHGGERTTFVSHGAGQKPSIMADGTLALPSRMDSVMRVSAAFSDEEGRGYVFAESHYELHFQDVATGVQASTNLNRFSFLPSFIMSRMFFPSVVESAGARAPAVLVPGGMNAFDASEVFVPSKAADGRVKLTRPAALRLEAGAGCVPITNPVEATRAQPTRLRFFCGDHLVEIPLAIR